METTVINIKTDKTPCVFIGRPSIYGNPFVIGRDGDRHQVLEKYLAYFRTRIITDESFKDKIEALKGKTLGCFCKPEGCHGDIIKAYLDRLK